MEIVSALEKHFKIELDVKYRYVKIFAIGKSLFRR